MNLWCRLGLTASVAPVLFWAFAVLIDGDHREMVDTHLRVLDADAGLVATMVGEIAGQHSVGDDGLRTLDSAAICSLVARLAPTATQLRLFGNDGQLMANSGEPGAAGSGDETAMPGEWIVAGVEVMHRWLGETGDYPTTPTPTVADFPVAATAMLGERASNAQRDRSGALFLTAATPVVEDGRILGVVLLTMEGAPVDRNFGAQRLRLGLILLATLAISWLLSWGMARRIQYSLGVLADGARRFGQRETKVLPMDRSGIPELERLSQELNGMASEVERRLSTAEQFAAELAHELRNPLTSLRSAVETAHRINDPNQHRRLMEVIVNDVVRLDRLIAAITDFTRAEGELQAVPNETVDLAAMVDAVVELERAGQRGEFAVNFELVTGTGDYPVRGIDNRLAQVVRNLIQNAISFSPPGGTVRLAVVRTGDWVQLTCEDDGPGVPEGKEEAIFQRFYSDRPEGEAFGHHAGLGLSLARQIVVAHGGQIWAENRGSAFSRASGARFSVLLPAANLASQRHAPDTRHELAETA